MINTDFFYTLRVQNDLRLTQPLSPWHFASTDDYDQFIEDREQWGSSFLLFQLCASVTVTNPSDSSL